MSNVVVVRRRRRPNDANRRLTNKSDAALHNREYNEHLCATPRLLPRCNGRHATLVPQVPQMNSLSVPVRNWAFVV